jgi:hypothetical protein
MTSVSTDVRSSPQATGDEESTAGFKLLLDVPARQPALGFPSTARALAEIVMESDPQFAIGIFGGWGSGKTTLMRAIEDQLDSDRAISVQFSAWRYEKEEHLIVPLLDVIRESLVNWADKDGSEGETAKRTAATIGKATRSILAGLSLRVGLPNALEVSFEANKALQARRESEKEELDARVPHSFYHASFRALSEAFEAFAEPKTGRRIVVFVDDLDRCFPESALQVLESMKLFFDLQGFVFVVALDKEVVQQVIDLKYGRQVGSETSAESGRESRVSGEEYIKKVFQVPYQLAPVVPESLDAFLSAAYEEARLPQAQRDHLHKHVERHLSYVVGDTGVNPREIKRYINAYTLQRKISEQLDPDVVLVLQTIAFRPDWRHVHNAILAYGPFFVEALGQALHGFGQPTAVKGLDPELTLPDSLLEYLERDRPGEVILSRSEKGTLLHADGIDRYIYRGEAVRSPQDPFLLRAIRGSAEARRLLMEARLQPGDRVRLLKEASRAFEKGRLGSYLEFGSGSVVVRELLLRDWNAYLKAEARLREPEKEADLQAQDLEELSLLAGSISDRLLGVYRAGAAPAQRVQRTY